MGQQILLRQTKHGKSSPRLQTSEHGKQLKDRSENINSGVKLTHWKTQNNNEVLILVLHEPACKHQKEGVVKEGEVKFGQAITSVKEIHQTKHPINHHSISALVQLETLSQKTHLRKNLEFFFFLFYSRESKSKPWSSNMFLQCFQRNWFPNVTPAHRNNSSI